MAVRLRWLTRKLDTVPCEGLNPSTMNKIFFVLFRLFRVSRSWTGSVQMKSSMIFIRGNRCIETEKDNLKNGGEVKRLN